MSPTRARPRSGDMLAAGRYRCERVLGQGGMGAVYVAVDTSNGARLALKRLRPDADARAAAMFEREYRILAGLRHPGIVEVYEYGSDDDGAFYTMELVEGHDLQELAPVPWRRACALLRDAASILGLLHARRLLHRDLSPRNLIETASGRLKLLDFGALADFGRATEIAGTPPFVPPEALGEGEVDQRSDLFALGVLGYWLITGSHPYPARRLADLPDAFQREPALASTVVRAVGVDMLEPPPPALDETLALLLRVDPRERLSSTAELIERCNLSAELAPEISGEAAQGYLESKLFVGREAQSERAAEAVAAAQLGRGQVLLVEGDAGVGRSRFLQETRVSAQLAGARVLWADASAGRRPYALAASLLRGLERLARRECSELLESHAAALAPIHPVAAQSSPVGEARARLQRALLDVFAGCARAHALVLIVDDLEAIDEESRAWLIALAHSASQLKLGIVASLGPEPAPELAATLGSLRRVASGLRLPPLSAAHTRELLRSVFGEVPYLDRLGERLHRVSAGNPAHCLELAEHLVHTGVARYLEGSWLLPTELDPQALPHTRRAGRLARLERLSGPARALARALSVPHTGVWTAQLAELASSLSREDVSSLLDALHAERVLRAHPDGFVFAHAEVREQLCSELPPELRASIHRRLGTQLSAALRMVPGADDVAVALCACTHFLRAADVERALPLLTAALGCCTEGDPAQIGQHAPAFEEITTLLSDLRQDEAAVCGPLAMLSVAGYFVDRRYALRYGERALASLQAVLRLRWVDALAPWLGRKLALLLTLGLAALGLRLRRAPRLPLQRYVHMLLLAASTLAGTAAICMDPERARRYARTIQPFEVLGPDHVAALVHDFSALMCLQGRDRASRLVHAMRAMIDRLAGARPIREMTEILRASYYAGAHLTIGVFLVRRDDREGLAIADKLERFSPLYAMSADHLRANYHAGQGELETARRWRKRLEVHAVQLGSAWQVETWAPVDTLSIALRLQDASELKRAAQELERLSAELPSLALHAHYGRVSYLVLRGHHREALALAAQVADAPFANNGWLRSQGVLARAHNGLGQHAQARELCLTALSGADLAERQYVIMNLGVEIELALAEAGLGRHALAQAQLEALQAKHAPNQSAVTLGSLHEARARVALLAGELGAATQHVRLALELYQELGVATLVTHARALLAEIEAAQAQPGESAEGPLGAAGSLGTRVQLMLRQRARSQPAARVCLEVAAELCEADSGFLVLSDSACEAAAYLTHEPPDASLIAWAAQSLSEVDSEASTVVRATQVRGTRSDCRSLGEQHYRVVPLRASTARPVGALVLHAAGRLPVIPEPDVLRTLAKHLAQPGAGG